VIEQATGILAERTHIGVDAAFAQLRAYARERNRRLSDVARDLIDGRLDAARLSEPAPYALVTTAIPNFPRRERGKRARSDLVSV